VIRIKIPFLDLRQQYLELEKEIDAAVLRTLKSGWYVLGAAVSRFEEEFGHYLAGGGNGYAVGVNSGTDALKLSLLAAGVGPGDEVVTVANTAIPTVAAICSIGAIPVFCDVDPASWLLDPLLLAECITARTRAVLPVHLYGSVCAMDDIMETAARHGVAVVEDVAQATGALWQGAHCGTVGDFGAYSFYPSKNLGACGDAGAIFVRTEAQRDLLRRLRNYGQSGRYLADEARGENSRLDELQAAILSVKLGHLERWNQARRSLAQAFRQEISRRNLPVGMQAELPGGSSANHLFVVTVPPLSRERIIAQMEAAGVQCLIHYPHPLYRQPAFAKYLRKENPVAETLCASVLSLPFHPYLTPEQIGEVVDALERSLA
jgi:dTDP-4-amino-4,6-dideoxygalactose transaminase